MEKYERKGTLGRHKCRRPFHIEIILKEIRRELGVDWPLRLAQGREQWRAVVSTAMNKCFPQNAGNLSTNVQGV